MLAIVTTLFAAALAAQTKTTAISTKVVSDGILEKQIAAYKDLATSGQNLPGIFLPGEPLQAAVGRNVGQANSNRMRMELKDGNLTVEPAPLTVLDMQKVSEEAETNRDKKKQEAQKVSTSCAVVAIGLSALGGGAVGGGIGSLYDDPTSGNKAQRAGVAIGAGISALTAFVSARVTDLCRGP